MTQKITDPAVIAACDFVSNYHADLGCLAPQKFSREEQHAISVLAAYIREVGQDAEKARQPVSAAGRKDRR